MNGFRTSRALVVDDIPKQAMAIVQTLGLLGIASVYHDAGFDRDYTVKHSGVRLLLLDMVLENRGVTEDNPQAVVGTLIGALEQLLDPSPGFVVVVCWTRHEEIKDLVADAFKQTFPKIHLADVVLVKKEEFIDLNTGAILDASKFEALISNIKEIIDRNEPAALLSGWEQLVHSAASRTTGAIYEAAQTYSESETRGWDEGAYAVCSALALAERGSRLAREEQFSATKGLTDALGPLLLDRIEHYDEGEINISDEVAKRLLETVKQEAALAKTSQSLLSSPLRATLNTSFNLSLKVSAGDICPGTIYLMVRGKDNRTVTKPIFPDKIWQDAADDTFVGTNGQLPPGHFPVLIEVTPPCDFAQAKGKMPRFLAGFLIPISSEAIFRDTSAYIRTVSFFKLANVHDVTDGDYRLAVNAHYLMTMPPPLAEKLSPSMRLRSAIMADLIAWLASQMSRPGFVQVTPFPPYQTKGSDSLATSEG